MRAWSLQGANYSHLPLPDPLSRSNCPVDLLIPCIFSPSYNQKGPELLSCEAAKTTCFPVEGDSLDQLGDLQQVRELTESQACFFTADFDEYNRGQGYRNHGANSSRSWFANYSLSTTRPTRRPGS